MVILDTNNLQMIFCLLIIAIVLNTLLLFNNLFLSEDEIQVNDFNNRRLKFLNYLIGN